MIGESELVFNPELRAQRDQENNPETSEAELIREAARNLRFELLETDWERIKRGIDSLIPKSVQILTSNAANYIGPLGAIKMGTEAVAGKTFAGQKLTPLGRINHFILQGLNVYAHYAAFKGKWGQAGLAYGVSWSMDAVQYYPEILSSLRDLAKRSRIGELEGHLGKLEKILDEHQVRELFFKENRDYEQQKPK